MSHGRKRLSRAKGEAKAARMAIASMEAATSLAEYHQAWQSLLDRLEKIWRMAERESQVIGQSFRGWQGRFANVRKTDELLRYLHHARNADQHTVQISAWFSPIGLEVSLPAGKSVEIELDRAGGKLRVTGDGVALKRLPAGFVLVPFEDRGETYNPPRTHLGQDVQVDDPVSVAKMGLAFYEDFLRQIEERFFSERS